MKPKDVKVNEKEVKEAKKEKASDVVDKIMSSSKDLVESPTEDSYASAVKRFKDVLNYF